eukprot:1962156-Prymnesium_polylepis.1
MQVTRAVSRLMSLSGEQAPEVLVRVMQRLLPEPQRHGARWWGGGDPGAYSARKEEGPFPYMQGFASSRGCAG